MYRAKELGRNNFQFYGKQMNVRVNERLELQRDLRRAIDNAEIFVHYQPQLALGTGLTVAVEALARWNCGARCGGTGSVYCRGRGMRSDCAARGAHLAMCMCAADASMAAVGHVNATHSGQSVCATIARYRFCGWRAAHLRKYRACRAPTRIRADRERARATRRRGHLGVQRCKRWASPSQSMISVPAFPV